MDIVIPDDFPPTYGSLEQADLLRLARFGAVQLHTTRAADREIATARAGFRAYADPAPHRGFTRLRVAALGRDPYARRSDSSFEPVAVRSYV